MKEVAEASTVDFDELVSAEDAAALLHQKPMTLAAWRCGRIGPTYYKIGRRISYRRADLLAWVAGQRRAPRTGAGASRG